MDANGRQVTGAAVLGLMCAIGFLAMLGLMLTNLPAGPVDPANPTAAPDGQYILAAILLVLAITLWCLPGPRR